MRRSLLTLTLLVIASGALAHDSWISRGMFRDPETKDWCCGDNDCRPVDKTEIRESPSGCCGCAHGSRVAGGRGSVGGHEQVEESCGFKGNLESSKVADGWAGIDQCPQRCPTSTGVAVDEPWRSCRCDHVADVFEASPLNQQVI